MLGVSLRDRIRNEDNRKITSVTDIAPVLHTLLAERMVDGAEKFWCDECVPEDIALEGLPLGEAMTWSRLWESGGCETHRTDQCGDTWGRPMSSSRHFWTEIITNFLTEAPGQHDCS